MTNAIIHADLMVDGVLKVEKYDNKFVFTNPGLLKLPVEQIYAGEETKARNQRIQNMFRMIGFGENLGSGFPLILSAWNEKHWLKPELVEQPELLQVKLVLTVETKEENPSTTQDVVKDVVKDDLINDLKDDLKELTERQRLIYDLIQSNDRITILELTKKTSASEKSIRRDIDALRQRGLLTREGGRKSGRWVVMLDNDSETKKEE